MENMNLNLVYFSPTGGSKQVAHQFAGSSFFKKADEFNLTNKLPPKTIKIHDDYALFSCPVYGGRVQRNAAERFSKIKGVNSRAIIIVTYGNREYDDALLELSDIVNKNGFDVIAAGAFVAEHSLSSPQKPVAMGRPDEIDYKSVKDFATRIEMKIKNEDFSRPLIKGNFPYTDIKPYPKIAPETIDEKCTKCGVCEEVCPVDAIKINDKVETFNDRCIWCNACVKYCEYNARIFQNDIIKQVSEKLYHNCSLRREPEFFI